MAEGVQVENRLEDNLKMLIEISGLDQESAEQILSINDNNLERAINYHLEGNHDPTMLAGPSNNFYSSLPSMPSIGYDETNERLPLAGTSKAATLPDEEHIRAPIPPKREQMIMPEEDIFRYRKRRNVTHNVCPLRNFQEEGEMQEAQLAAVAEGNPFLHNNGTVDWKNGANESGDNNRVGMSMPISASLPAKRSRLGDLFRPPTDLSIAGSLQTAREYAKNRNRWLIVNLQDYGQFQSQTLNRDVWSDQHLRSIIKQYFVLWQIAIDNPEGMRFQVFYSVHVLPYIGILDPRTGEERIGYNGFNKTSKEFVEELLAFLRQTPYPNTEDANAQPINLDEFKISEATTSSTSNVKQTTPNKNNKIETSVLSEEDQLLLAIQNSLREITSEPTGHNTTDDTNADSNDDDDDGGVIDIDFESDSDIIEVKENTTKTWNDYLGDENDPKSKLILRLPDGNKELLEWPCTSKVKALKLYVMDKYPDITKDSFKIICPFPRQDVLALDQELTLKNAQLHPTVTLHLHQDE